MLIFVILVRNNKEISIHSKNNYKFIKDKYNLYLTKKINEEKEKDVIEKKLLIVKITKKLIIE